MDSSKFSNPLSLKNIQVTDRFWKKEMELVRTEVIPYQWNALNDRIPDAAPSYCMRNYRRAGEIQRERKEKGSGYIPMKYPVDAFETLPKKGGQPDGRFYGFVFQDSDFSKWIEAVAYSLAQHPDAELMKTADEAIDLVCAAQREDGYLDTYYLINDEDAIFTNLRDCHELYCFGHLAEGAVAYYQATGKEKLLNAAKRYADFIEKHLGTEEGKKPGYPGHEIAEMALMRLYGVTGDEKYRTLARYFIDERGKKPYYFALERGEDGMEGGDKLRYNQAHQPVREQKKAVGHAVRAVYLYSGMADVAKADKDEELFAACRTLWDNIVNQKMYITGGIGATHLGEAFSFDYDLPNDTAYAETCASIGLIFFARRMLEICPKSEYADVMERALYNGVLSGMALDGKSFFYVNPLEVLPKACREDERKSHVKPIRQKWFGCACCPPNLARLISSIGGYAYTEKEDTLFTHLYIGGELALKNGSAVALKSELPWDGNVSLTCKNTMEQPYTFAFRIPGWCRDYKAVTPDGAEREIRDGYLYLTKKWEAGECILLSFPMEVRFRRSNPLVRENVGKAAITRGPIVYCMEEADNGTDLHLLEMYTGNGSCAEKVRDMGETFVKVSVPGRRTLTGNAAERELYFDDGKTETKEVLMDFIPYYMWNNRGEGEMQVWVRTC